ncbi:MAG: flavodoxin [Vallitalea sp.]|jgi:flavodoxin|nr:flavodoxin [Vallitalea sp.]
MVNSKKLVVFYSLGGNTKFISEEIKKEVGADLLQLKVLDEKIKAKGIMKYLKGGKQALSDAKPKLEPFNINLDNYDTIIIGTPIWASNYVPAINTFLTDNKITNKKIALFCCHAGGGSGKVFEKMRENLKGNSIIGEIEFKNPLKVDKINSINILKKWLNDIL